jgi:hypothetical protein
MTSVLDHGHDCADRAGSEAAGCWVFATVGTRARGAAGGAFRLRPVLRSHERNSAPAPLPRGGAGTSRQLFDHFVGARKERWRYGEAKRLCGLKINRQLEPSWLNDRQFGRLLTF